MKFETQPQATTQEIEGAKKEVHMTGRAKRLDETTEEYKTEREKSWAEKQQENSEKIERPQTNKPLSAGDQKIEEYVNRIKSGELKESIFQGLPETFKSSIEKKLASDVLKSQRVISDQEKANAIRSELGIPLQEIKQEDSQTILHLKQMSELPTKQGEVNLSEIERTELKQRLNEIDNKLNSKANRENLKDDAFMVSNGMLPDGTSFETIDPEIGGHYNAHGIIKSPQLENLLNLLENGVDPQRDFSTGAFVLSPEYREGAVRGTQGGEVYQHGIAVISAGYRESIKENGIKHVFINDAYREELDPIRKLFPNFKVHLLSEQKNVMEEEVRRYEKQSNSI